MDKTKAEKDLLSSRRKKFITALVALSQQSQLKRILIGNLIRERRLLVASATAALENKTHRVTWMRRRHGQFWEKDVPRTTEKFFIESFRMDRRCFKIVCENLKHIARHDSTFRKCIPLEKRIAIALYALRSSAEYSTIGSLFGVSKASVHYLLLEFCKEIWEVLGKEYLGSNFMTQERIKENVDGFELLGFPQCFGALDGCHIEIRPAAKDSVDYHNYKGWSSMVLLALVDYRYRFMYINVGCPGSVNDSNIFERCSLKRVLNTPLLWTNSKQMGDVQVPVVILGDSAFRFSTTLMKPYPFSTTALESQKLFNYFLSKSRRVVENAFGHLKARFRRIGKGIDNSVENAALIIKACCVLHNFLNENNVHLNAKWLDDQESSERRRNIFQPSHTDVLCDHDIRPELIRSAIATFLSARDVEGTSSDGDGTFSSQLADVEGAVDSSD